MDCGFGCNKEQHNETCEKGGDLGIEIHVPKIPPATPIELPTIAPNVPVSTMALSYSHSLNSKLDLRS